eukprot:6940413-Heterocapsa_arctica.AAC.1
MRVLMKEHKKETWKGRIEWKSLDSVLMIEEPTSIYTQNKLDLDKQEHIITCTGRMMKMRLDSL